MGSLYHEKQVQLLCGVHALNTLLQGPYFTSEDLREIAAEFDQRERDLMKEAGVDSADFLRYMAEDSGLRGRLGAGNDLCLVPTCNILSCRCLVAVHAMDLLL